MQARTQRGGSVRRPKGHLLLVGMGVLWMLAHIWEKAPSPPPLGPIWVDTGGTLLHVGLSPDHKWRLPPSPEALTQISPFLLSKEDRHFWYHPGVYPPSLVRALWRTLWGNRQGGSTLSMQLARLWRPGPRTLLRKVQEIFWAFGIELKYTKQEILTFYLTYAPFGRNIEGIEAASRRYFGKKAERLTPLEIAALLLVSQRPHLWPAFERGEKAFHQLALRWVRRWHEQGLLTPAEVQQAEETFLHPGWHPFPRLPLNALPPAHSPPDTLWLSLTHQQHLTSLLQRHLHYWQSCGITQGAILLAEASTGRVLAYVPSLSYNSCALDLIQTPRSVGSTLKPFLWVLALEKGLIHSETPLLDAPRSYNGYVPINFERKYDGQVPASYALYHSLNAPAVELLHKVGLPIFLHEMNRLGVSLSGAAGPSIIVGNATATLYTLVQAYTLLATGGKKVPLQRTTSAFSVGQSLFSAGAAWIVSQILQQADGWSYKTGTTAYLRDAWCIGWNRRYVIGVWLGNPDRTPSGCLKGRLTALPLAQAIAQYLGADSLPRPPQVEEIKVCALTGYAPGPLCKAEKVAFRVQSSASLPLCPHERHIWCDTSWSYCKICLPADTARKKFRHIALPAVPAILSARAAKGYPLPPHFPACPAVEVEILCPQEGSTMWLSSRESCIPLEAVSVPTSPILWGKDKDTLGWQFPGEALLYRPTLSDTLVRLWAQVGQQKKVVSCRIRRLYSSSSLAERRRKKPS